MPPSPSHPPSPPAPPPLPLWPTPPTPLVALTAHTPPDNIVHHQPTLIDFCVLPAGHNPHHLQQAHQQVLHILPHHHHCLHVLRHDEQVLVARKIQLTASTIDM